MASGPSGPQPLLYDPNSYQDPDVLDLGDLVWVYDVTRSSPVKTTLQNVSDLILTNRSNLVIQATTTVDMRTPYLTLRNETAGNVPRLQFSDGQSTPNILTFDIPSSLTSSFGIRWPQAIAGGVGNTLRVKEISGSTAILEFAVPATAAAYDAIAYAGGPDVVTNANTPHPSDPNGVTTFAEYLEADMGNGSRYVDIQVSSSDNGQDFYDGFTGGSADKTISKRVAGVSNIIQPTDLIGAGIYRVSDIGIAFLLDEIEGWSTGWRVLTAASVTGSGLSYVRNKPTQIGSLTAAAQLPIPTGMPDGECMMLHLVGGAYTWDLSLYDFPKNNNDGSAFSPNQSTSATLVDQMVIYREGDIYHANWQRGYTKGTPA